MSAIIHIVDIRKQSLKAMRKEGKMVNFKASKADASDIHNIALRASRTEIGFDYSLNNIQMDITATHANGNPLKLNEFLNADDENFAHDIFGIRRHLNRNTGQLENCFLPRYSAC
jgi:hypothetical protein